MAPQKTLNTRLILMSNEECGIMEAIEDSYISCYNVYPDPIMYLASVDLSLRGPV